MTSNHMGGTQQHPLVGRRVVLKAASINGMRQATVLEVQDDGILLAIDRQGLVPEVAVRDLGDMIVLPSDGCRHEVRA